MTVETVVVVCVVIAFFMFAAACAFFIWGACFFQTYMVKELANVRMRVINQCEQIQNDQKDMRASFQTRLQAVDLLMSDQVARVQARDKEVDLVITDIPKRVQQSLQQAIALYVEPFAEDYREKKRKDDEPPDQLFDPEIVDEEKLEAWLEGRQQSGRVEIDG